MPSRPMSTVTPSFISRSPYSSISNTSIDTSASAAFQGLSLGLPPSPTSTISTSIAPRIPSTAELLQAAHLSRFLTSPFCLSPVALHPPGFNPLLQPLLAPGIPLLPANPYLGLSDPRLLQQGAGLSSLLGLSALNSIIAASGNSSNNSNVTYSNSHAG